MGTPYFVESTAESLYVIFYLLTYLCTLAPAIVITVINKREHLSRTAGVSHANYKIAYKIDRECHRGLEIANFRDLT